MKWDKCLYKVHNRGRPPEKFLNDLIEWCKAEPDSVFAPNNTYDIYSSIKYQLGPWPASPANYYLRRRAAMCEALRVLAGFESSWRYNAGRDTTNPSSNKPCTEEAGIFQCSGNAQGFGLKEYTKLMIGTNDCKEFIKASKNEKNILFIFGFTARLLRATVNHHGPVKRKEINKWLRVDSMLEFETALKE